MSGYARKNGYYWVSNDGGDCWQIAEWIGGLWFIIAMEEPCWDIDTVNEERIKTPQELRK